MVLVLLFALTTQDLFSFVPSAHTPGQFLVKETDNEDQFAFLGYVNARGTFIQEQIVWLNPPILNEKTGQFEHNDQPGAHLPKSIKEKLAKYPIFNKSRFAEEPVYEYRSGILVPGILNSNYEFVPEKGGKVLAFVDYVYSEKARRIYNLPGKFVRLSELKVQERK